MKYVVTALIIEAPTVSFADLTCLCTQQSSAACLCDLLFYGWGNMGFGRVNDLAGWVLQLVGDTYINPHCNRIFRVLYEDMFLSLAHLASLGPLFRGLSALKHILKAISKWSALEKLKIRHLCGCPWWEREQCGGLVENRERQCQALYHETQSGGEDAGLGCGSWRSWPSALLISTVHCHQALSPPTPRSLEGEFCFVGQDMGQDTGWQRLKGHCVGSAGHIGPGGSKRLGLEAALFCNQWALGILGLCSYIQGAERTFSPHVPPLSAC